MIDPTKRRLTFIFTLAVVVFGIVILSLSYLFLHHSIMNGIKRHMEEDVQNEFLYQFYSGGLEPFRDIWDEHHFQILNRQGDVVVSSRNSVDFYPGVNKKLLDGAFSGKKDFEKRDVGSLSHLVSYFPLDGTYVGRVAVSISEEIKYEKMYIRLVLLTFPGLIVLSFFVSRYLVNLAMKPISDVFTFQETFSSNVTHELRSPLASLKGNFEVSLRKERGAGEYQEVLRSGLGEIDRIIRLLNNLSLLASSKFKPLDLFKHQANISRIVKELSVSYAPAVKNKRIEYVHSEVPGIICSCDESLIRRTLENLWDNAVKYTPEGGLISAVLTVKKGKILLTISNTFAPADENEINHIFEPFYRGAGSPRMNAEGKGLGLYISRYIVRSHRGDITLDRTDNNLFSLTVSLPTK